VGGTRARSGHDDDFFPAFREQDSCGGANGARTDDDVLGLEDFLKYVISGLNRE